MIRWTLVLAVGGVVGCATIAGVDEDYSVGTAAPSGTAGAAASGGTTPSGVGGDGAQAATGGSGATGATGAGGGGAGATGGGATGGGGGGDPCALGYACLPELVAGDYVFVTSQALVTCPDGYASPEALGDRSQPGCQTCSCGGPLAGTCTPSNIQGYSDSSCGSYVGDVTPSEAPPGVCYDYTGTVRSLRLNPSVASASTCPSTVGQPAPLDTSTSCSLAQPPSVACGTGSACVPTGAGGPPGELCALLPAGSPCPPHLPSSQTVGALLGDTRSCHCSCQPSTGQYCQGGDVTTYSDGSCNNPTHTVVADGQCYAVSSSDTALRRSASTWTGGTCASVLASSGQVTWGPAETLCCP